MALTVVGGGGYSQGSGLRGIGASGRVGKAQDAGDEDEDHGYPISRLRRQFLDFAGAKRDELDEQRTARHYFHGDQLTAKERNILRLRRQPAVVRNKLDRKINAVVGLMERLRQDPKGYPRTPDEQDRGGDQLATATVRYVLDKPNADGSDWASFCAEAARQGAINGIFGAELLLEPGSQTPVGPAKNMPWFQGRGPDPDVGYAIVDPDTFFYDPRSSRYTFSDARYMGCAKWLDLDEAQMMFPDQADELEHLVSFGGSLETWQQRDREMRWIDTNEKRIFLVEHWYKWRGDWYFCFYVGHTMLKRGMSPFYDEKGKTICRYIMASVNIDHDGDRYGFIRNLKPLQDEVNARASKGLHILNVRRIIMEEGAVKDVEKARTEAARPDGVLVVRPLKRFEFDDAKSQIDFQGQLELLNEAKTEIENFGPNPALIGEGIENKSGRAIALLQQAGIAELGPFILVYRGWKLRVYRAIWCAVQRNWKLPRWITVTDPSDEQKAQFLGVNQVAFDGQGFPVIDEFGQPVLVNAIGQLDVDIILDEGSDTLTMMQDVYDTLTTMAQNGQQVPPEVLLELAPIPGKVKKAIIAKMAQANQPNPQVQAIQMRGALAGVAKTESEAARNQADAEAKRATLPANINKTKAETAKTGVSAMRELAAAAVPAGVMDMARQSDGGLNQFAMQ